MHVLEMERYGREIIIVCEPPGSYKRRVASAQRKVRAWGVSQIPFIWPSSLCWNKVAIEAARVQELPHWAVSRSGFGLQRRTGHVVMIGDNQVLVEVVQTHIPESVWKETEDHVVP